jgi:hypothetical protein
MNKEIYSFIEEVKKRGFDRDHAVFKVKHLIWELTKKNPNIKEEQERALSFAKIILDEFYV